MKGFVFYTALLAATFSFAQSRAAQEAFAPFTGKWQGVFKVFSYEGRLLDHITVEQHYWWESGEQHAAFIERGRDGRVVHAHARNYEKDGKLYCEVKKDNGQQSLHHGHFEEGTLFWYRRTGEGNILESFKERVVQTPSGREYQIDGFGVYGSGGHTSYLLFEGRYFERK